MIEIIMTVYFTSMALSFSLLAWHYLTTKRQLQSAKFKNLNHNLSTLRLYWSQTNGAFANLDEGSVEDDQKKALKNILWLSLLAFASLPGFLLLAAVIFSVRYLARSRLEVAVFESPLALTVGLPMAEVEKWVVDLKSSFGVR